MSEIITKNGQTKNQPKSNEKKLEVSESLQYKTNSIIIVTPEIAAKMLETNIDNRNVSAGRVKQYALDMKAGKWVLNGETIKIDQNGRLIDGQHRLRAVISAGASIPMEIAYDIAPGAVVTIDTGKSRNGADVLKMNGAEQSGTINSALRAVVTYEFGYDIGSSGREVSSLKMGMPMNKYITNEVIIDAWRRHANIVKFIPKESSLKGIGNKALFTALHYLFYLANRIEADQFMDCLYSGTFMEMSGNTVTSQPILSLNKEISSMYANRHVRPMSSRNIAAMTIKVWNGFVRNKPVKRVTLSGKEKIQRIINRNGIELVLNSEDSYVKNC